MNNRATLMTLGLVVWVSAAATTWATDIYVDTGAPGGNNGTSWLNAYHYLQNALAVAQPGDTIKVAQPGNRAGHQRPVCNIHDAVGGVHPGWICRIRDGSLLAVG